VVKGAKAKQWR